MLTEGCFSILIDQGISREVSTNYGGKNRSSQANVGLFLTGLPEEPKSILGSTDPFLLKWSHFLAGGLMQSGLCATSHRDRFFLA
jgi:hypothetical protein